MILLRTGLPVWLLLLASLLARAGGNEVVVIYNSSMPESKMVAEHYAQVRQVPASQIYGFALTTDEEMSRTEFRDSLQLPLAKKLEAAGLWKFGPLTVPATNGQPERVLSRVVASKIRYAVLCYGVPLKIREDPDLSEPIAQRIQPELRRNQASVDSELTWLPFSRMGLPLTGLFPNWVYATTNSAWINPTNGILIVARLDGPSAQIANALVDKAVQAERDGLWGRAYFDARGLSKTDTNFYSGDEWILGAAAISRELGFETTVDNQPETFPASFPLSQIALYCGWHDEHVTGPFTLPKVEFMPGAFAYHLFSYSATTLRSPTEDWCEALLAKGATCTMGFVNEPYLAGTPNVAVFLARWGAEDFTFGEAACAAQPVLSWQTTVIGDPLYRPFEKSPQLLYAQLARQHNPLLEWSFLRLANLGLVRGARIAEVASLIDNLDQTTNSAVLTEKLADIYSAQGKPASAIMTYQKALKLNPSPEQQIRLRLTLGEKLQAQGRNAEAVENYQKLLSESPDYPGKDLVLSTVTALQKKISSTNAPAKP